MPVNIHDIPPEILAAAFEIGIYKWGIGFISPLSCVCQNWRFVVDNNPRLWGIISLTRKTPSGDIEKQITKAKASPLSIRISPSATQGRRLARVLDQLFTLSANWVSADIGTAFLSESGTRWNSLRYHLEALTLSGGNPVYDDPGSFFEDSERHTQQPLSLHTFSVDSLPKAWTMGFLGPWIKHFYLRQRWKGQSVADTWDYLAQIPKVETIELCGVQYRDSPDSIPSVRIVLLPKLKTLRLKGVIYSAPLLLAIEAVSLQTLSIRDTHMEGYGPFPLLGFFLQWSEPNLLTPTHLHTLELIDCLRSGDTPYLIRWLRRLPNLVRLLITDDQIGAAATSSTLPEDEEGNLYNALAYPQKINDESLWLCPSLMILYLDTTPELTDLIPIARSRGGITPPVADSSPPARLRRLESRLCPVHEQDELDLLKSLVDEAICICTHCGLTIEDNALIPNH